MPSSTVTFAHFGLPDALVGALARRGVVTPFPVQAKTLPDALAGRDVLGRGQTGSGKTLGFGLPLLTRIAASAPTRRTSRCPRGVVLVPTRELARQVYDELAPLAQVLGLSATAIYGGAAMSRQIAGLNRGVDVVVATPGRLIDLVQQDACRLGAVEVSVLDEADHMSDLGFLPAVSWLLDKIPAGTQRLLFSATLDGAVDRLVARYLTNPVTHAVEPAASPVDTTEHHFLTVTAEQKIRVAAEIAAGGGRTLFFVRTKHGADRLAKQLDRAGVRAGALHGGKTQNARIRALADFSEGHVPVLVATDVAARGIHVDAIDLVVHFDPPAEHKAFLHRSGRTARAGASGVVVTLVLSEQARDVASLRTKAGVGGQQRTVAPGDPCLSALVRPGGPLAGQSPVRAPARAPAHASVRAPAHASAGSPSRVMAPRKPRRRRPQAA